MHRASSRSMMMRVLVFTLAILAVSTTSAAASDKAEGSRNPSTEQTPTTVSQLRMLEALEAPEPKKESIALPALYAGYVGLQIMDMRSTAAALRNGAYEVNPLMTGTGTKTIAIKAATTAATIFFVNRIAKQNKKAAIITMLAINGVTAAVAAHNIRNAR